MCGLLLRSNLFIVNANQELQKERRYNGVKVKIILVMCSKQSQ